MLMDDQGNPISEGDPRLPTVEGVEALKADVDRREGLVAAAGVQVSPLVTLEAQVLALVSLFVPPEGEVRLLFEQRVALRRAEILDQIMADLRAQTVGPALQIARTVPRDLPRGFDVV